jgi:4-alpha-glucanotransferase
MRLPRASGILLHPTSLPGRYGIGDLGPEAHAFVRFLAETGQRWWQILPLGPTGVDNSPYQSYSSHAGNPLLISPDRLVDDGWLDGHDCQDCRDDPGLPETHVDFDAVIAAKHRLLRLAFERFQANHLDFESFLHDNAHWLDDYALYMALKDAHEGAAWYDWEPEIAARKPTAIAQARKELASEVLYYQFVQYAFDRQWRDLRSACAEHDIKLIGDLPIFVAQDSADVWARPDLFQLDEAGRPLFVAGVPPDYFSETGQLWGNPLYRWEAHASEGFAWWIARMKILLARVDLVRLDHFRGFEAYWEVPAGSETAATGRWALGPGTAFLEALRQGLDGLPLIAEDLGDITAEVEALRDRFDLPGMRVLQFAFGRDPGTEIHLPHKYINHCVAYTGTHDNDTTAGWFHTTENETTQSREWIAAERAFVLRYVGTDGTEIHWDLIRLALGSVADTVIIPLQDVLGLDGSARMNIPGRAKGNWRWRFQASQLDPRARARLADLTAVYGRWNGDLPAEFLPPRRDVVEEPFVGR